MSHPAARCGSRSIPRGFSNRWSRSLSRYGFVRRSSAEESLRRREIPPPGFTSLLVGVPSGVTRPGSAPTFLPMLATCRWISSSRSVFFFTCSVSAVFSASSVLISSVFFSVCMATSDEIASARLAAIES